MSATREDYLNTFDGFAPGRAVLDDLVGRFFDRNVYVAGGIEAQRETERRAAQREVIRYILTQMEQRPETEHEATVS